MRKNIRHRGRFVKRLSLLAGFLSLFFLSNPLLYAKIQQWDLENAEDYRFDARKMEVRGGVARLLPLLPYEDKAPGDFDRGTAAANTGVTAKGVELKAYPLEETQSPQLPLPLSGREEGLAALWHFDEPSGTNVLDEVARNVAKTSDAPTVSGQTGFGFARIFDGEKSSLFIPHYQTLRFEGPFSVSLWIKPSVTVGPKPQTLVSRWQAVGAMKSFAVQINPAGKLDFLVSPDGAVTQHHTGDRVLVPNAWTHVAAVYTGDDLRIYVNGVLDGAPTAFRGPVYGSTNPVYAGALVNTRLEDFYNGVLDELALYGRALTETEAMGQAGNASALVGLWHLNEKGGIANDSSGYGGAAAPNGKPEYESEGKIGTAVQFNGRDQFLEVNPDFRFAASDRLTLSAWIKPAKLPGSGQNAVILSSFGDVSRYALLLTGPDGRLKAEASTINPGEVTGRIPMMPGVWQHVAASWGAGTVRLYVNGVLDTSLHYSGFMTAGKSGIRMAMDDKNAGPFEGALDETAVYRRVLGPEEVSALAGLLPSSGSYISGTKDAGSPAFWRNLEWKTPFAFHLPVAKNETGLLHAYFLDENQKAGVLADFQGQAPLTPVGTYPVGGIFSQGRWFQAKGYDKLISQNNFPALSTFTVSLWFQFATAEPGASDRLFSIGDANPTVWRGPDGRLHAQMLGARELTGESLLQDTRWHHLALVSDGRSLFLYIDGRLDGNSPLAGASADQPLVLGNLKTTDTFQGALDEFLLFNYALEREKIFQHFLRGKLDLKFLLRSSNLESLRDAAWKNSSGAAWLEEEPGADAVGLWHLNEERFRGEGGEVRDATHFANHGSIYGRPMPDPAGNLGRAVFLNGAGDAVMVPDSQSLHLDKQFTLSAWIRPLDIQQEEAVLIDKKLQKGAPVFSSFALDLLPGNKLRLRVGRGSGYQTLATDREGEIAAERWNHVAATYDGSQLRLYINGRLIKLQPFRDAIPYDNGPLYFGRYGAGESRYFAGEMDEILIESRARTDEEIADRFSKADPERFYRTAPPEKLPLDQGRYFQYQAFLSSGFPLAGPALESVKVQANSFAMDKPAISNLNGVSFAEVTDFRERLGAQNKGSVTYQISNDGANFFFHNGKRWVIASSAAESNTQAQIAGQLHTFSKEVGIGSFYFRAFLHSPLGIEPAELDGVEIEYLPNKLTVTSPNGGEAWTVGSSQMIRWTTTGNEVAKVSVEYSRDDFKKDFQPIATDVSNTGSVEWKVPDDPSANVKVRVMDSMDPRIHDVSDISFRIAGGLELLSPNWNERWEAGSEQAILWKTIGKIGNVKIDFSADDFVKTVFPIVDSLQNEGKFVWKVPDHISSSLRVRVSDVRDPLVFDASNDVFAIVGKFEIVSPAGKARWIAGSRQTIRWQNSGTIGTVRLDYASSKKDGWTLIEEKFFNRNRYEWTVPDDIDKEVRVRVSDASDLKVNSESAPFSIVGGLRLLTPKGGESWSAKSRRKISWQTIGTVPVVDLEYRLPGDDAWTIIEKAVTNIGSYVWEVPENLTGDFQVRVSDPADSLVQDENDTASRVVPGFEIKSPNGGESFLIGSDADILWETHGRSDNVKLEYSKDGFVKDIHEIMAEASNIGRFSWKVPDDASGQVSLRVSNPGQPQASDTSDTAFRIHGDFQVQVPKGGEKFEVGSLATLEWKTTGTVPNVRIEYSHDDFVKDRRTIAASVPNTGRTTWAVPDDIGAGYSLRLTDIRDERTTASSQGYFSVVGNFHLVEPRGGDSLIAGTTSRIVWKSAGTVPAVHIDYSENDFTKSFNTLAAAAPNKGFYEWTVPDLIGHQFKLRIWDPSNPGSMDVMTQPARITGGFRLLQPNGGEVLNIGDTYEIQWQTLGTIPRVKLEFSADSFNGETTVIADAYENTGSYHWQMPDTPTGLYRIRVSDPRDSTAFDISNADFRLRSRFTLVTPNGGEGWPVGSTHKIRWQSSGSVPEVSLEYSDDDFKTVRAIEKPVPNTGEYEWTVPDQVSQNVKVRVADVKDPDGADASDHAFRIQSVFKVKAPEAEIVKVGQQRTITWETTGSVPAVQLEYSRDGFSSEAKVIAASEPNMGAYTWTIPDDLSTNVKVRVTDVRDPEAYGVSEKAFQIAAALKMIAPAGGEVWHATEKREINWVTIGSLSSVNLEFSADDFKTAPEVIDQGLMNTGRYEWEIPRITGESFKVRVCDSENPQVCAASVDPFSVRSPLEIVFPRGGEIWTVGTDQEIRWNTYGRVDRVMVEYIVQPLPSETHGEWKRMAEELTNEGHYLFRVPDAVAKKVFFRVSDWDDESLQAQTVQPVSFMAAFRVLSPNGKETWPAGTVQKIRWDTLGTVSAVRLEYSNDDFKNDVNLVESAYSNTGSYDWKVPPAQGLTLKVRVSDETDRRAFDVSDDVFEISAGLTLLEPNGGEKWIVGSKHAIKWQTEGKADTVKLEYLVGADRRWTAGWLLPLDLQAASDRAWVLIADRIANGGEYEWTVPDEVTREMRLRVSDSRNPRAFDVSDDFLRILPDIKVQSPAPGGIVNVSLPFEIRWSTTGRVDKVKIEYSKDGFTQDVRLVADGLENTGVFLWTPPDDVTESARIRVTNFNDTDVAGTSENFSIFPQILPLRPASGEKPWTVGTPQAIQWDWRGSLRKVKIEYSANDFATVTTLAADAPNSGKFTWQVPDLSQSVIRFRISDAEHARAQADSAPVKILPGFQLAAPKGGELAVVGETFPIEWQTAGTSERVRLEYGVLNVSETEAPDPDLLDSYRWKFIEEVLPNTGRYEWRVPDDVSSAVKVRVSDALDFQAFAASAAPFKILGQFKILAPAGDEKLLVGSAYPIKWQTTGKVPSVKLEFARPSGEMEKPQFEPIENLWLNSGSYYWTVPDAMSEHVFLKISDAREPDAFTVSEVPFAIRGALKLEFPDAVLNWAVGSTQTLHWTTVGTIPEVDLSYSTDGQTWKPVSEKLQNAGTYGWTIPEDTSLSAKIRISDSRNPAIFDESTAPIVLAARFEILEPKAGNVWTVASKQILNWRTFGKVEKVWLEYAAGPVWKPIAGPVPDSRTLEWQVPDDISGEVKVRIRDGDNPNAFAVSEPFKIAGALALTVPAGGEFWTVGSVQPVTWQTTGTIPKIKMEALFVPKDQAGETQGSFAVAESEDNKGRFEWKIPDTISDRVRLRISDVRDDSVSSTSPEFKVAGFFELTNPKENESWIVGTEHEILWNSRGTMPGVVLEYSRDDFYRDINTIAAGVPDTQAAVWTVPDAISDHLTVRLSDARDAKVFGLSKNFKIRGDLSLVSFEEGEVLSVGAQKEIRWNSTGTIPFVRLEYSRDDFRRDIGVLENTVENKGNFLWTVPDIISTTVKVRVTDVRDNQVVSPSPVFRVQGVIHLASPQGGERLQALGPYKIVWQTTGAIAKVRLEYSRDDFNQDMHLIAPETANEGSYDWMAPDDIGAGAKVRVADAGNPAVFDASRETFEIHGALRFTTTTQDKRWEAASEQEISWESVGTIPAVKLEYSRDDFQRDIQLMAGGLPNQGRYIWTIPDAIADHVRIRVSDERSPEVFDVTTAPFSIVGKLKLVAPKEGSVARVGKKKRIAWETQGTVPLVKLEYAAYAPESAEPVWKLISGSVENTGKFSWLVPDDIEEQVTIRISDLRDPVTEHQSAPFPMMGRISLVNPRGGERWIAGTSHDLVWKTTGTIPDVILEFSADGFKEDVQTLGTVPSNSGAYSWKVPDRISEAMQVRARDARYPALTQDLSKPFSVIADFIFSSPQSPVVWKVGSEQKLQWQTLGTVPKVRLEYSIPGTPGRFKVIQDLVPNQGEYLWRVPDEIGSDIRVRITDTRDSSVFALTPGPVKIDGDFQIVSPQEGEAWTVGEAQTLEWKNTGTVPNVTLEYSQDGFRQDAHEILSGAVNENRFLWKVPDTFGDIQIRVRDSRGEASAALSPLLRIRPAIRLLSPVKGEVWTVSSLENIQWSTSGTVPQVRLEYSRDNFQNDVRVIEKNLQSASFQPSADEEAVYPWQVPDALAEKVWIRVSDVRDPRISSTSPEPFRIQADFEVLTPQAGDIWPVGSAQEIRWKTLGTVSKVRLEYSRDQFQQDVQTIAAELPNAGDLRWKVPDSIGQNWQIRVSDAANSAAADVSGPLTIQGKLFLQSPKGGEIWKVGEQAVIAWESVGSIPFITIESSTDDFMTVTPIASRIPNQGRFLWPISDRISDKVRIRVRDANYPEVSSEALRPLKIQGSLLLASPQGGEFWQTGSQHPIVWQTTGTIPFVSLEYSTDNFATVAPIILGLANQSPFVWTVPDLASDHVQIRIFNAADQSVASVSKPLEAGGALELVGPAGGEVFTVGDTAEIRWKTTGTIPQVRLELSGDDFRNDVQTLADTVANNGTYSWKIPEIMASGLKVRVSDLRHPKISDVSRGPFKIAGSLKITSPEGGESWQVASRQMLRWQTRGKIPFVRLEYSQNNFVSATPIAMQVQNTGDYAWEVPDLSGTQLQFRVSDASDPSIMDTTLYGVGVQAVLSLVSPAGGEMWTSASEHPVIWRSTGTIPQVNVEYSLDDFQSGTMIAGPIANTGSYVWKVPDFNTRNLKLRVVDSEDPRVSAGMPAPVTVQGKLDLVSPAGGEVWLAGSEHPIEWNSTGKIDKVQLEYSTDDFETVFPITLHLENQNKFLWRVPDAVSRNVKIRVTDDDNLSVVSESAKPLEVRGILSLASPVGGEVWSVGSRHAVSWQTTGTIPQVRLEFSVDDFKSDVQVIVPSLANEGVYYWEVPPVAASEAKIRVTDAANPQVFDVSPASFKVAGELEMLYPNWSERFQVGQHLSIRWRATPNITHVKLEYSDDDFQTSRVISDYLPNSGKFDWNLPADMTDNFRVRVSDASNALVYAFSAVPSSIQGSLKMLSPKGGELWTVGSTRAITWQTQGKIPKVRIEYSSDDFKTSLPVAAALDNEGTYEWTIPEIPAGEIKFRVSDSSGPSVSGVSAGSVKVRGSLELSQAGDGGRWVVGESRILHWQTHGYIPKVDLDYSKDNFDKDIHLIASSAPNLGSFDWTVPNDPSPNIKIRIQNSEDASVSDVSEQALKIDFYHVRWIVRDSETGEQLPGLTLTDSTGLTDHGLTSPVALDYPYGIYTSVWTKQGYGEFHSTWLADKDQTFSIKLDSKSAPADLVRVDFKYDRDRDLMGVKSWYERGGRPVPAVIQSEVRIYEGGQLLKTLSSSTPDSAGYFHMVWDTSSVPGDKRYLASATILTAAGKSVTSPISYQLNLPVKETKEPVVRQNISSAYLRPVRVPVQKPAVSVPAQKSAAVPGAPAVPVEKKETPALPAQTAKPVSAVLQEAKPRSVQKRGGAAEWPETVPERLPAVPKPKEVPVREALESQLIAPQKAIFGETISITYMGPRDSAPVLDLYSADHQLVLRGRSLKESDKPGSFTLLIPIKGLSFVPGKSVTVSVIERKTGRFKKADILIESSPKALGLDQEIGTRSVLDHLAKLDGVIRDIRNARTKGGDFMPALWKLEGTLSDLAGILTEASLNDTLFSKLNEAANELAELARAKGYNADFLTFRPLDAASGMQGVSEKVRGFRDAIAMLQKLSYYASGAKSSSAAV